MNEKVITEKQKEVALKKQIIFELKSAGYTHEQTWVQLNEKLKVLGIKSVSVSYVYKYWNMMKNQI
ncbi:peptide ABC transporter substrate-binding protein [Peribacillus sp. ACCC06369]|uniref:peptide ABC transporter substrate-binding protein n=1 Tax=Peribacillus sp. ACCC06369 TaxID=3055860 RepID=UPI0025A26455|nr:peptide ABC transporter substrate-binding protein [Peribacillus sp. ACCC06369]MDM5361174.1 peptide ABC transporter substrate-binding protein [Peribacillus sp. ACCC06369]